MKTSYQRCPWLHRHLKNNHFLSVRFLYYLWIFHGILYTCNLLVGILYLFAGGDKGRFFGLAFIYWILFVPLSYLFWFRPAYKAFKNNSSVYMKTFFLVLSCQIFMCAIHFLGIGGTGSSGLIVGYNILVSSFFQGGLADPKSIAMTTI